MTAGPHFQFAPQNIDPAALKLREKENKQAENCFLHKFAGALLFKRCIQRLVGTCGLRWWKSGGVAIETIFTDLYSWYLYSLHGWVIIFQSSVSQCQFWFLAQNLKRWIEDLEFFLAELFARHGWEWKTKNTDLKIGFLKTIHEWHQDHHKAKARRESKQMCPTEAPRGSTCFVEEQHKKNYY